MNPSSAPGPSCWLDTGCRPPQRLPDAIDAALLYVAHVLGHPVYVRWSLAVLKRGCPSLADAKREHPAVFALLHEHDAAIEYRKRKRLRAMPEASAPSAVTVLERTLRQYGGASAWRCRATITATPRQAPVWRSRVFHQPRRVIYLSARLRTYLVTAHRRQLQYSAQKRMNRHLTPSQVKDLWFPDHQAWRGSRLFSRSRVRRRRRRPSNNEPRCRSANDRRLRGSSVHEIDKQPNPFFRQLSGRDSHSRQTGPRLPGRNDVRDADNREVSWH